MCIFEKDSIYLFLDRGEGREKKGRETSMCGCLSHTPYWGPDLKPRQMLSLGIKPATLWFAGGHSIHWATAARAQRAFFKNISKLANFCVAILMLKMEENKQHFSILCFIISKKVKTQKKICAVYGGAVTDWMCQKWFTKFHAEDFLHSQWGRPVEVNSDQIKRLTENNQRYTTGEIADILRISKSIKLLMKMKNVSYFEGKKHTDF